MLKYLSIILCLLFTNSIISQNNAIELSVQQGHAKSIEVVSISPKKKYIVTAGNDKKVVVWDYRLGTQIGFLYLPEQINNLTFLKADSVVYCKTNSEKKGDAFYEININKLSLKTGAIDNTNFSSKVYVFEKGNHYYIDGPKLVKLNKVSGKRKVVTSDYYDQPFLSLSSSNKHNLLFASCEDGFIYVFDFNLKLITQLKGHLSGVNHTATTKDEVELISVSKDRSIIKWALPDLLFADRYTGKSYATYGLSFNTSNGDLLFGDEVGFLKTLNIKDARLKITSNREALYPILHTKFISDSVYVFAGEENNIVFKNTKNETLKKTNILTANIAQLDHLFFVKIFGFYRAPFSKVDLLDFNPVDKVMLVHASNTSNFPNYFRLINTKNFKKSKRLFLKEDSFSENLFDLSVAEKENRPQHFQPPLIASMGDNSFVISNSGKEIMHWVYNPKKLNKIKNKTFKLDFDYSSLAKWDKNKVLLSGEHSLKLFEIETQDVKTISKETFSSLKHIEDNLSIGTHKNKVDFKVIKRENGSIHLSGWFSGHKDAITSFAYDKEKKYIFSSSLDGTIRVWDTKKEALVITIIPVGSEQCIYVTPDNYYMTSGKTLESFGFKKDGDFFLPEQFDPFFNRPDIVLERLGYSDPILIDAFHKAYIKRLNKMNFTEDMLKNDFHIPSIELLNKNKFSNVSDSSHITLKLKMHDAKYKLDRYQVWVNDVPVFGKNGVSLRDLNRNEYSVEERILLSDGLNIIKTSCTSLSGAESYKESVRINHLAKTSVDSKVYYVGIGVDQYAEEDQNLSYCRKDIKDLSEMLKSNYGDNLIVDTLINKAFTLENIKKIKAKLLNTHINDRIIVSYSGHGILNENFDYFLGAYNVNFNHPEQGGIAYESLEWLLDSIPARNKLMLLDACHSGEVDKTELKQVTTSAEKTGAKGAIRVYKYDPVLGMKNSFELMQELFTNLNKGTGATIISAAAGNQFAYEKGGLLNGVFTYSILELLNESDDLKISELKQYVSKRVSELTNGAQKPTSRSENIINDWYFWD